MKTIVDLCEPTKAEEALREVCKERGLQRFNCGSIVRQPRTWRGWLGASEHIGYAPIKTMDDDDGELEIRTYGNVDEVEGIAREVERRSGATVTVRVKKRESLWIQSCDY